MPSNVENILNGILTGDGSGIQKPTSRVEELLFEIYEQGGGGGGESVIGGIKLTIDENYVMTATLVDKDGEEYGVGDDIDLPLEEMVVDAEYDPQTQKIKLELKNGNYVEFSVAELVSGLQTELSSSNKLNPAYIDYDASHRAVSDTEKDTWNAKQNAIDADHKLSSSLVSFSTAEAAALASGIDSSKVGQISTNQSNILYAINTGVKNIAKPKNIEDIEIPAGVTVSTNGKGHFDVSGTASGTFVMYLADFGLTGLYCSNEVYIKKATTKTNIENYTVSYKLSGSESISYKAISVGEGGITIPAGSTLIGIYLQRTSTGTASVSASVDLFICDSSLKNLSEPFTPYALPNYDLTRMVSELQKKAVKVYTYHVNPNESDPEDAVTYLDDATGLTPAKMGASSFSYGSWANAWFLPRPCVLKFDGTVDYYLNPNDYSKKVDGTASTIDSSNSTGNVMLEFPKIWVKRTDEGNGARTVSIAPVNVDGTYKCWSNINAEDKEVDHFYLPAYNGTIHSNKMRSLSGVILDTTYAPNYTRAQEVTAATANNPTGKNMWYTETWADFCLIYDLLYLMGKSLDVQRTFGQGLSSGSETAMRAYVTGTHNAKGLFYGDISGTSTAVKVLGMENLWGCRWHGVAGLINDNGTLKVKMTYGVADGSTAVGYNTTGSGYLNYGSTYGTAGYVKKMQADNTMGYKIIETAGTDATYYCDYYYVSNSQSNYALFGGGSDGGSGCGFYVYLSSGAGRANWSFGGSLSCRP